MLESVCKKVSLEALVEGGGDSFLVHLLPDENEFLHAVAVLFVPVACKRGFALHEVEQLVLGHGGVPLSGVFQLELLTGLLEDITGVVLRGKIAHTLGTDDLFGPVTRHEIVEEGQTERTAGKINKRTDSVLLRLTFLVVMVVVMVMMFVTMMVLVMFMFVMLMLVLVIIIVIVIMMVMLRVGCLHLVNPCGRAGYAVKIESSGSYQLIQLDIAVVAFDDFRQRLYGSDDGTDMVQLILADLGGFVQEDHVAELNLLNDEVLDVVFFQVLLFQVVTRSELVAHA